MRGGVRERMGWGGAGGGVEGIAVLGGREGEMLVLGMWLGGWEVGGEGLGSCCGGDAQWREGLGLCVCRCLFGDVM